MTFPDPIRRIVILLCVSSLAVGVLLAACSSGSSSGTTGGAGGTAGAGASGGGAATAGQGGVGGTAAAGGAAGSGASAGSGGSGSGVPQWSTQEIVMTSQADYANGYTDVQVDATFTGPGGASMQVRGFWDGGHTFKVRFTPTLQGSWTYSIKSSPADAGLTRTGSLDVGPPAGSHGFLRRDSSHPESFVFDDGTRFFMMGQTYYGLILNALDGGDWQTSVTKSKGYGFTKIRLLLFPWSDPTTDYGHPYVEPFTTDHDHVRLAYWTKMDSVISYIQSQGLVADLILFADSPAVWGTSGQNDRYLRYALARYAGYPNLIWCVTNEWNYTNQPKSEFDHLGGIVAAEDPYFSSGSDKRALSIHQQTRIDFQYFSSSWPTHAIIQYGPRNKKTANGDEWGNSGILYNNGHNMPVVNDEYGYAEPASTTYKLSNGTTFHETRTTLRNVIWGIALAGGYGTFGGDSKLFSPTSKPIFSGDWMDEPGVYGDIKVLSTFFDSIQYWTMTPENALVSGTRVYALGTDGNHVVYAAAGGTFSVKIAGPCAVTRLDPRTGVTKSLASKPAGTYSITTPDAQDYVYHLTGSSCH